MSKLKHSNISNSNMTEFYDKCHEKSLKVGDRKFREKDYIASFGFKTKNSSDIKYKLLCKAVDSIDRDLARKEFKKYIKHEHIVDKIESGLFEFALVYIITNKFEYHFVENIYYDQLHNLCVNLDTTNKLINNTTLLSNILDKLLNPYFIAFLPPELLHPKNWSDIIIKKQKQDEITNNINTTDLYKCAKCGERKFRIIQMQMRSADEPTSSICTCMVCYNTFIK